MNKENLLRLAETLERVAAMEKPEIKFDMSTYYSENMLSGSLEPYPSTHTEVPACGTVACALGFSGLAGFRANKDESWKTFGKRIYALTNLEFNWCFSMGWQWHDNTALGAAKRIRYLVHKDAVPDEWLETDKTIDKSFRYDPSYYMEDCR